MSDEELVRHIVAAPERDVRAFEQLVNRYQAKIVTNCRYLANATDAEDQAQDVFVKVYFALDRFEGRSAFRTWIQRIKVNHCLNFLQRRREAAVSLDDPMRDVQDSRQVAGLFGPGARSEAVSGAHRRWRSFRCHMG